MMRNQNNKHRMFLIVFFGLVFILGVGAFFIIRNILYSATLNVMIAPSVAKVKVGDKEIDSMGVYKMMPGEYLVEVSAEGFYGRSEKIELRANETMDMQLFLDPQEENENWYQEHPNDRLIRGEILNTNTIKALERLKAEYPIIDKLPIETDYYTSNYAERIKYTISYELKDNNSNIVIIIKDYTGGNYYDSISKLQELGVDTSDYEIQYKDLSEESMWGYAGDR